MELIFLAAIPILLSLIRFPYWSKMSYNFPTARTRWSISEASEINEICFWARPYCSEENFSLSSKRFPLLKWIFNLAGSEILSIKNKNRVRSANFTIFYRMKKWGIFYRAFESERPKTFVWRKRDIFSIISDVSVRIRDLGTRRERERRGSANFWTARFSQTNVSRRGKMTPATTLGCLIKA